MASLPTETCPLMMASPQTPLSSLPSYQTVSSAGKECKDDEIFVEQHSDRKRFVRYPSQIEFESLNDNNETTQRSGESSSKPLFSKIDRTALQFAFRMATLLTVSSLFVLVRTDTWHYPDGMWVIVSVLFVCWFPALDAASVIEKIIQRLIGTFVGAVLGLSCGFISIIFFQTHKYQAIFLGCCMFLFNFGIIFFAGQCKVGRLKVIRRYAYATILCVLTFYICMLPFSLDEDPKWLRGVYRVINVIVGCLIGALGAITVCPKSTTQVLYEKAAKQVKMAGDASEAIMHMSADFFAGRISVNRLADELLNTPLESELRWKLARSGNSMTSDDTTEATGATDVALKKYEDAIADWRASKALFPLAKYDPFRASEQDAQAALFHTEIARTLARALRIQTTIVVLDGMVRSDADYLFTDEQLNSFAETGSLIRRMLTLPLQTDKSDEAARRLFDKLEEAREAIRTVSIAVSDIEESIDPDRYESLKEFQANLMAPHVVTTRTEEDELGRGIPRYATDCNDNSLFFLQLVEHLILRSLRLYQAWKHVEMKRSIARDKLATR